MAQTRQEYIRAAVNFLQEPSLIRSPLEDKLNFLKGKGLNQVEVDEALNLALIQRHQTQNGRWNFLLVLGVCAAGYKLYKVYKEAQTTNSQETKPQPTKPKSFDRLEGSNESELDLDKKSAGTLDEILRKLAELKVQLEYQRTNTQADIQSLKTLLLSHDKFAAPPVIPEWQLKKEDSKKTKKNSKEEEKHSKDERKA